MVQIANIKIPENKIVVNKIFIADKVVPIAIQEDPDNKGIFKILFAISQGIDGKTIFIETRLQAEDSLDTSYITNKAIYLPNIIADPNKKAAYQAAMEHFNVDCFYFGDFAFHKESNTNHTIKAYREIVTTDGKKFFERATIHVPRYMYVILNLYLDNLMEPFSEVENIESFFVNKDLRDIRFEKIEQVKLVATCKTSKGTTDDGIPLYSYNTHYEMNCGPKLFRFNYEIITEEDRDIKVPLDASIFMPEYSNLDNRYIGLVQDQDCHYVVIYDDDSKIKALKIPMDLMRKTNIVNPYFIFKNYRPTVLSQEFVDENGNPRSVKVGDKILRPLTEEDLIKITNGLPIDIKIVNSDKKKNTTKKKKK